MRVSFIKAGLTTLGSLTLLLVFWGSLALGQELATSRGADGDTPDSVKESRDATVEVNTDEDILDLDIEELGKVDIVVPSFDVEVTSVTRSESTVGKSPAAVFVVTQEMIRRSGATSVPEALRLVPGLQVARIDAHTWAISSRGFNLRFSSKLLVLIDGRSVYTPLYSGVFWETQDLILQDIQRIEVIRGPGATAWGANAVNGVISIITKQAEDTQGAMISSSGGDQDKWINSVRYGGNLGEEFHYRVYAKHLERNSGFSPDGAHDDWRMQRYGLRGEWLAGECDTVTFQGELHDGRLGTHMLAQPIPTSPFTQELLNDTSTSGGFALTRWTRRLDDDSEHSLQVYYDRTERDEVGLGFGIDVFDVDFQHRFLAARRHHVTWGARYRHVSDKTESDNPFALSFDPADRYTNLVSGFVQDEISIVDDEITLTAGSKFEHNDFTGFEIQPSIRALWAPDERQAVWAAVSRAVRRPARADDDVRFRSLLAPPFVLGAFQGSRDTASEDLTALEVGYRVQQADTLAWGVATFFNIYDDLLTMTPTSPIGGFPPTGTFQLNNVGNGETYGGELNWQWQVADDWRLTGWYSFLQIQTHNSPGEDGLEGNSPHHQAFLMSSWDLPCRFEFDVITRYVDNVPAVDVSDYISMDLRLGWRPNDEWELSVVGQSLLEGHRLEFRPVVLQEQETEVNRGIYAQVVWRH